MGKRSSGILALNINNGTGPAFYQKTTYPTETSWVVAWIQISELESLQKEKSRNEPEDNSARSEENIDDSSPQLLDISRQSNSSSTIHRRRNNCPGKNGRTCYQCHQKTLDFVDSCKSGRQETSYCPYCRWICDCGRCMKKKGLQSVGIRGRVGKTTRFPSIMERLAVNSSKNINEVVDHKETSATEESLPGSDRRRDASSYNSMEVHLRSEVDPRVGVEEEKSERADEEVKNISIVIKTLSSRNDVIFTLLSPSRVDYESLLQPSDSV